MRPPSPKQKKLFAFLERQKGKPFTLKALLAKTGYGEASAERSLGEHWAGVVQREGSGVPKKWRTRKNFERMSLTEFHHAISQSKRRTSLRKLKDERARELLGMARSQAHVALELLNRPGLPSRVECFLMLFINAWELLLKAEVVERDGWAAVFMERKKKSSKPPRSLGFETLVAGLPTATNEENALRAQLTDLYELRNQAAHLLLSGPSREMLHLFAGSTRSLSERFLAATDERLFASDDVAGFLVLVGLVSPSTHTAAAPVLTELDERIQANIGKYGEAYAISLRVRVYAIEDDLASAAAIGKGDVLSASTTAVRDTYRYKRDEVARRVTRTLADSGHAIEVRPHEVDLVRGKDGWGTKSENPFVTQFPAAKLYSEAACDRIVALIEGQSDYLDIAKRQERNRQANIRKKKKADHGKKTR